MKNTLITSALVAILGLALTSISSNAQTDTNSTSATPAATTSTTTPSTSPSTTPKPAAKTAKKSNKTPYSGKITAISATSVTVTGAKTLTLAIDGKTKYEVDKKKAALTDFAVGDSVTGSYEGTGTNLTAASLHKKTAAK